MERADKNLLVAPSVRTKDNDIGEVIVPPSLNSKPRIAHIIMGTKLQTYFNEERVHSVIGFLSTKGMNPLDINRNICSFWQYMHAEGSSLLLVYEGQARLM